MMKEKIIKTKKERSDAQILFVNYIRETASNISKIEETLIANVPKEKLLKIKSFTPLKI